MCKPPFFFFFGCSEAGRFHGGDSQSRAGLEPFCTAIKRNVLGHQHGKLLIASTSQHSTSQVCAPTPGCHGEGGWRAAEQTDQLNPVSKVLKIPSNQARAQITELVDSGLGDGDAGSALSFALGPRVTCSLQLPFSPAPTPALLWNILSTQGQVHRKGHHLSM